MLPPAVPLSSFAGCQLVLEEMSHRRETLQSVFEQTHTQTDTITRVEGYKRGSTSVSANMQVSEKILQVCMTNKHPDC